MLTGTEARSTRNQKALDRLARRYGGAAFLLGPTDGELTPLRLAEGMTEKQARSAYEDSLSSPQLGFTTSMGQPRASNKQTLGGARWVGTALAASGGYLVQTQGGRTGTRQPLVFVALYDDSPDAALVWERMGWTPWRQIQVWLAANLALIGGALIVLFLASAIASPFAFVYERRRDEEMDLERERERVRRQARERVIDRLTELSDRVDSVAADSSGRASQEVSEVALDIESTVRELRTILGELSKPSEGPRA